MLCCYDSRVVVVTPERVEQRRSHTRAPSVRSNPRCAGSLNPSTVPSMPRTAMARRPRGALRLLPLLALAMAAAQDAVVKVHTGPDLQEIVNSGTQHMLIVQHLDLRGLLDGPVCAEALCVNAQSHPHAEFITIRGACNATFDGEGADAFPALYPHQCVLLSNNDVFKVDEKDLWLHNMHVYSLSRWEPTINILTMSRARVWQSQMGMQSDHGDTQLILMISANGSTVVVDGFLADASSQEGPAVKTHGAVALENVVVANTVSNFHFLRGAVRAGGDQSRVRLSNVTFDDASLPAVAGDEGSTLLFADDQDMFNVDTQVNDKALPLEEVEEGDFLTFDDEALLAIQWEVEGLPLVEWVPPVQAPAQAPAPTAFEAHPQEQLTSIDPRGSAAFISVISTASISVVLLIAGVGLYAWGRRKQRMKTLEAPAGSLSSEVTQHALKTQEEAKPSGGPLLSQMAQSRPTSTTSASAQRWSAGDLSPALWARSTALLQETSGIGSAERSLDSHPSAPQPPVSGHRYRVPDTLESTYTNTLVLTTTTHQPQTPVQPMSPRSRIEMALDHLYTLEEPLFGRYRVPTGVASRRRGGQAMVQFVEDANTRQPLAAKFFITETHFLRESELYGVEALRDAMPQLVDVQPGGWQPQRGSRALAFPPCLIMDRGECMTEYVRAAGHNLFTTAQALGHVASKLADLHREGWVHRDIEPANLLWTPSTRSWSLLDFGCAARAGTYARLAYSIAYVAPEVFAAEEAGEMEMVIHPALDMWALGVIAFEMLAERRVFPAVAMKEDIVHAALGRSPLP